MHLVMWQPRQIPDHVRTLGQSHPHADEVVREIPEARSSNTLLDEHCQARKQRPPPDSFQIGMTSHEKDLASNGSAATRHMLAGIRAPITVAYPRTGVNVALL